MVDSGSSSDGATGRSTRRLAASIAIIVVALSVAVYFTFLRRGEDEQLSNRAEDAAAYVCRKDGHKFSVTPRQFEDMFQRGEVRADPTAGTITLKCPKCGEFTATVPQPATSQ